jgi:tRNA threonylcarbamoyladenosine biosynthesis protein TsaB
MVILAIDTALGAVAACAYDAEADSILVTERTFIDRGHAEAVVPLLDRIASRLPGRFDSIDRVVVTTGPGSFTGIRVGVAAAKSIGIALDVEVVGVSTLTAFAAPLLGREGFRVGSVIDARHGNVYFECFDAAGAIVHPAAAIPIREAAARLRGGATVLAGPGASLVAIEAWSQGVKAEIGGEAVSPDIAFVARLGALADAAESPARPFYLKAADVTPPARSLAEAGP